jgi:hypothetical protein
MLLPKAAMSARKTECEGPVRGALVVSVKCKECRMELHSTTGISPLRPVVQLRRQLDARVGQDKAPSPATIIMPVLWHCCRH